MWKSGLKKIFPALSRIVFFDVCNDDDGATSKLIVSVFMDRRPIFQAQGLHFAIYPTGQHGEQKFTFLAH